MPDGVLVPAGLFERLLSQIPHESLPPERRGRRRIALAGLSKNAGKTTALNFMLQSAPQAGYAASSLGLVSTGRDGEFTDAVTDLPKPLVWAPAGALVVTVRDALTAGGFGDAAPATADPAALDELSVFPWETPWGPVVLARVRHAGHVVLVGPGSVSRLQQCLDQLEAAGATLTLIDGSLDRLAAAAPGVADGVVLSCGAAAGESLEKVVELAAARAALLRLPVFAHAQAGPLAREFIAQVHAAIARGEAVPTLAAIEVEGRPEAPQFRLRLLGVTTALGQASAVVRALGRARILVVAGALPGSLLARLNLEPALTKHLHIIVGDGTRVQPDMMAWRKFHRLGGRVWAAAPIRLLGLTSNPWRPQGPPLDADALLKALHDAVPDVPVCDVHLGRCLR